MASPDSSGRLASAVSQLSLNTGSSASKGTKAKPSKAKKAPVADSWEDESLSSDSESDTDQPSSSRDASGMKDVDEGTQAPPPTPISPTYNNAAGRPFSPITASYSSSVPVSSTADGPSSPAKRPEKTDAVARRMIAAGLGLKVPKQTEEQKAYDRAVREKERKRRQQEKEEQKKKEAELEKARQAIWED
ncbi:hypothetical protein CONLIGDRAFT_641556 [Coniochaeta ligniaria NRRL 30616]|uniref:Ubiquitin-like protein smt3 n=1 Tax=Coniochaeta ligniaria NRRL 30616 TaxID=1408157 RepID=A0A1J7IWS1_9PEZI|nr:hypothetical protein CONLIGDRAFT_641556 [Coniochaeta ligniaria NRRL 30616]